MELADGFRGSGRGSRSFFSGPTAVAQRQRSAAAAPGAVALLGLDYRTAPLSVRERLAAVVTDHGVSALERLGPDLVSELAVISTCNRFEVCYVPASPDREVDGELIEWLVEISGVHAEVLDSALYRPTGEAAVVHLLRVACGLESQMLGEAQVLGQIAQTLGRARSAGSVGPILSYVLSRAVHTGKRARTETTISSGKTSISRAAAQLVRRQLGGLGGRRVVVLGAGDTASLVLEALVESQDGEVFCVSRSLERAQDLARRSGCQAAPWSALGGLLREADALVTATSAPHTVIGLEDVRPAVEGREQSPLLVVDIAVPRDVHEAVGRLAAVRLFDIDDLETTLDQNRKRREAAVPQVESIVAEETREIMSWLHGRRVAPLIQQFRVRARSIADAEAARALGRLGDPGPREREVVTSLARQVANKILHEPTVRLKNLAGKSDGEEFLQFFVEIFGLEYDNFGEGDRL